MKYQAVIRCAGFALLMVIMVSPAFAGVSVGRMSPFIGPFSPQPELLASPEIDGEVIYTPHDGTFETGFTFPTREDVEFVQFWAFPSTEGTLTGFEACFYSFITVVDFEFEFVYYGVNAAGENAEPGSLKEDRDSRIFDIPAGTPTCSVINFVAQGGSLDPGVEIRDLLTYLGVKWNGQDFPTVKILVDANGPESTNGWGRITDFGSDWIPLRLTEPFAAYRNLGIRFAWLGPTIDLEDPIFDDDFESGDTSAWSSTVVD